MIKQKFTYLYLFSFSFLSVDNINASPLTDDASVSLQNDGLIYLIPEEKNKAFIPKDEIHDKNSGPYTGNLNDFNEFFITLHDKNGNEINDKNLIDQVSINLDKDKTNSHFIKTCEKIKFKKDNHKIHIIAMPEQIYTLTNCHFNLESEDKTILTFQLKLNYPFKSWVNLSKRISLAKTPSSVMFAQEIDKRIVEYSEKKEIVFKNPSSRVAVTLDLSSIYNLDIFPKLEKLNISGYRIYPADSNSFAFPKQVVLGVADPVAPRTVPDLVTVQVDDELTVTVISVTHQQLY